MIPIDQTICNFKTGDCMRACVASVFEIPIEKVPNFMEDGFDNYNSKLQRWCDKMGMRSLDLAFESQDIAKDCLENMYVIAVGRSPRGTNDKERHGVVWKDGKIVHDPHPDKNGLDGMPTAFTVFIPINPASIISQ